MPATASTTARSEWALHTPLVIGHRGAPGYRPEHTAEAYRLACELGADAVEPDIVVSRDGELVVRHENEISGTTDIAERPEFAHLRTTKTVDGVQLTGWFTEDLTWAQLQTLYCRERLPKLRPKNVRYNDREQILRLRDVLDIVDNCSRDLRRDIGVVIEIKHAQYFADAGVRIEQLLLDELAAMGWADRPRRVVIECFELRVLDQLREAGAPGALVFLTEHAGAPADEVAEHGKRARPFSWFRSEEGLDSLVGRVEGVSVAKADVLRRNAVGQAVGVSDVVSFAQDRGFLVYTWTLRPENRYLNMRFHSSRKPSEWGNWRAEFSLILGTGIDGIFVDHPDLGVEARAAYREND